MKGDASYLVTGGLGALGLQVAKRLVDLGARTLVLTGRSGGKGREEAVQELERAGARIHVVEADVSRAADVARVMAEATALAPLRGVVHAAGVLDDGVLRQQTLERFAKVMGPKIDGSWFLHEHTKELPLDFFICFSSVASLLGSPGQGNYAAANAFMDALAHHRRAAGLPALSINWGPWSGAGMAAQKDTLEALARLGLRALSQEEGLTAFTRLLRQGAVQVGVVPVDWTKFLRSFSTARPPFYEKFAGGLAPADEISFRERLTTVPVAERRTMLNEEVLSELAQVLGYSSHRQIRLRQGLSELGLDSLGAIQLKRQLEGKLELKLPSTLMFDYPTLLELSEHLAKEVLGSEDATAAPEAVATAAGGSGDLEELSQEQVAALLAAELSN